MITSSKFKPAWWLPGPHLQTLWPFFIRRDIPLNLKRERIELPGNDFLDLDWVNTNNDNAPIVLVLHGLEGSIESKYARGLLKSLSQGEFRPVLMNFRGCSGEHNRLPISYHLGETSDLAYVVDLLQKREPNTSISAVGFSLGGNVLLKWLGETRNDNPLEKAVAISVPFELHILADKINQGFSKIYQNHLLKKLRKKCKSKNEKNKLKLDINQINNTNSFWDFDNLITAPLYGFENAMDYYQQSSSRQFLKNIKCQTLILHAANDPLMTEDVIPNTDDLSDNVTLEITKGGGHVGFIYGSIPGLGKYWLDKRVPEFLKCQDC